MIRLAWLCVVAVLAATAAAQAEPLDLTVRRIEHFGIAGGGLPVGPIEFLGGLDIGAENGGFGGFSGIEVAPDGAIFMVSDTGSFVRARLVHEDGRLVDVGEAEIGSLFPEGDTSKQVGDAEDVALDPGDPARGVIVRERQPTRVATFGLKEGRPSGLRPKLVGADNRILRSNKGLESVAFAPPASPVAGGIVAIAERAPRGQAMIPAWIAGVGPFEIVPHDDFDVSSARFLANGDLMLLERRYTPGWGIAMRLRRIGGDKLKVGATLDGDYLLDVGMAYQIDNMEGLSVHEDAAGRTILTIVSDDNHSILQRTLILQFALNDAEELGAGRLSQ